MAEISTGSPEYSILVFSSYQPFVDSLRIETLPFCREIKIPIIGVVENMSGLICPNCKEEIDLFKTGGGEKIAAEMKIPFLGRIPLDPEMVICSDEGSAFVDNHPDSIAAKAFFKIADEWKNRLDQ